MALVPSLLLKQLYTFGSLENTTDGIRFSLKNRLSDATLTGFRSLEIDGKSISVSDISLDLGGENAVDPATLSKNPLDFPLRRSIDIRAKSSPLEKGKHQILLVFDTKPFGKLKLNVEDSISDIKETTVRIPRNDADDYSEEAIQTRQKFVEKIKYACRD